MSAHDSITFDSISSLPPETMPFPARIKPLKTRPGLYKRRMMARQQWYWAWWDGKRWYAYGGTQRIALLNYEDRRRTGLPDCQWCGLAQKP